MPDAPSTLTFRMFTLHYILRLDDKPLADKAKIDITKSPSVPVETRKEIVDKADGFIIDRPTDGRSVVVELTSGGAPVYTVKYVLTDDPSY